VGIDVQHLLIEEKPEVIIKKVEQTKEIFREMNMNLILSVGNSIMPETPWENIEALFNSCHQV
jgi:uroporphyrinogen-III decarboxylase